jgi:hypothetical protein
MIDFTSEDFTFISREDEYYTAGTAVIIESDCSSWKPHTIIKDGWGLFRGYTTEYTTGMTLPVIDGDTSTFEEFDIYYKDQIITDLTYSELQSLIVAKQREDKIEKITDNTCRYCGEDHNITECTMYIILISSGC